MIVNCRKKVLQIGTLVPFFICAISISSFSFASKKSGFAENSQEVGKVNLAPFTSVNEYSGELNITAQPIGSGILSVTPAYVAPNQSYGGRYDQNIDEDGALGQGWHIGYGYIQTSIAELLPIENQNNEYYPQSEVVTYISGSGSPENFYPDATFNVQQISTGGSPYPQCLPGAVSNCIPINSVRDKHYVNNSQSRLTRTDSNFGEGKYYLLSSDGSKIEFVPSAKYRTSKSARFYPVKITRPTGQQLVINYQASLNTMAKPRMKTIVDSQNRELYFSYYDTTDFKNSYLKDIKIGLSGQSSSYKILKKFDYARLLLGTIERAYLHKIESPMGRTRLFNYELRSGVNTWFITSHQLEDGGLVDINYDYFTLKERFPHESCEGMTPAQCNQGWIQTYNQSRVQSISYQNASTNYDYVQRNQGDNDDKWFDVTVSRAGKHIKTRYRSDSLDYNDDADVTIGKPYSVISYEGPNPSNLIKEVEYEYTPYIYGRTIAQGNATSIKGAVRVKTRTRIGGTSGHWKIELYSIDNNIPGRVTAHKSYMENSPEKYITTYYQFNDNYKDGITQNQALYIYPHYMHLPAYTTKKLYSPSQSYILSRVQNQYTLPNKPFITCTVDNRVEKSSPTNTTYTYYDVAPYKGLIRSIEKGDKDCNADYNSNRATTFSHYRYGVAERINKPLQIPSFKSVNIMGQPLTSTEAGVTTTYTYDDDFRITFSQTGTDLAQLTTYTKKLAGGTSTYRSWSDGTPITESLTDKWGRNILNKSFIDFALTNTSWTQYDNLGRVKVSTLPTTKCTNDIYFCARTETTYDKFGLVDEVKIFNDANLLESKSKHIYIRNADGGHSETISTYKGSSNLPTTSITSTYDELNRITEVKNGTLGSTYIEYTRTRVGIEKTITQANGDIRMTREDLHGNVMRAVDPEIRDATNYTYDARENILTKIGPEGSFLYTYDDAGRIIRIESIYKGIGQKFSYNDKGLLIKATSYNTGATGAYHVKDYLEFDSNNRPTRVQTRTDIDGVSGPAPILWENVYYSYNNKGRLDTITYPSGNKASYEYAYNGVQKNVFWFNASQNITTPIITSQLDKVGNTIVTNYLSGTGFNAANSSNEYDELGRLTGSFLADSTETHYALSNITYTADNLINSYYRNDQTYQSPRAFTFSYDTARQLDRVRIGSKNIEYDIDNRGNVTRLSGYASGSYFTDYIDTANNITLEHITNHFSYGNKYHVNQFTYDNAGRVLNDGNYNFHYNYTGTLYRMDSLSGVGNLTYLYDTNNLRVSKQKDRTLTSSIRSENGSVLTSTKNHFEAGVLTFEELTDYVYINGQLVAEFNSDGTAKAMFSDYLGSTVASWSNNHYEYHETSPYGREMISSQTAIVGQGGFTGHENDDGNYVYMKGRYYNKSVGAFITPDPAKDFDLSNPYSFNLYQYTGNNPVNRTDPSGYASINVAIALSQFFTNGSAPSNSSSPMPSTFIDGIPILGDISRIIESQEFNDTVAGWGDAASFGLTTYLRKKLELDMIVDQTSTNYMIGEVGGTATNIAYTAGIFSKVASKIGGAWAVNQLQRSSQLFIGSASKMKIAGVSNPIMGKVGKLLWALNSRVSGGYKQFWNTINKPLIDAAVNTGKQVISVGGGRGTLAEINRVKELGGKVLSSIF